MTILEYSTTERNVLLDEFLTPVELIEACFEQAVLPMYSNKDAPVDILDVGANDGRWGKVARKHFPYANITGIEIMAMPPPADFDYWFTADYITFNAPSKYDLIIGNPPYTVKEIAGVDEDGKVKYTTTYKAEDFVRKSMGLLDTFGSLFFLLRSNFRHSLERTVLWEQHPLFRVYDCTLRPSFYKEDPRTEQYGTKQTNAHDYALFVWYNNWHSNYYLGKQLQWSYNDGC